MKINHWKRESCRLCNSTNVEVRIPLSPVPIGEKYYDHKPDNEDPRFPIDIYSCNECQCIQTLDCIDNDYLWSNYTYFSGQNDGIIKHQNDFAKYILRRFEFENTPLVVDIGSNDGTLLKSFKKVGFNVFGVDPAETVANVAIKSGIDTYIGLFTDKSINRFPEEYKKADLITAFNVFAHSDEMQGMIDGIKILLKPNGIFCFEVQYLKSILDKKLLGTIFHEHMIHYSVTSAKRFLEANGLHLFDLIENNIQKGSIIFFACKKDNEIATSKSVLSLLDIEKNNGYLDGSKFAEFNYFITEQKNKLEKLISLYQKKKYTIAAYGAARSGPTLCIQYGITNVIEYLIDDHPSKIDKFSAFEGLLVKSTAELKNSKPEVVIILAWIHSSQIIINHIDYLEEGGKFIILFPEINEIDIDNYKKFIDISI